MWEVRGSGVGSEGVCGSVCHKGVMWEVRWCVVVWEVRVMLSLVVPLPHSKEESSEECIVYMIDLHN